MKTLLLVAVLLVSAQSAVAQNRGAMARADTNGDQAISLEEFQTARTAQFSRACINDAFAARASSGLVPMPPAPIIGIGSTHAVSVSVVSPVASNFMRASLDYTL